jgi:magnesium transporter
VNIKYYQIRETKLLEPVPADRLSWTDLQDQPLGWLDVADFQPEELRQFLEPLDLHPLVLEDCLQPEDNPSVAAHGNALFIKFPTPFGLDEARPSYLSIVCLPTTLITIHQAAIPALDRLAHHLTENLYLTSVGLSSLLYRIFEGLIEQSAAFGLAARKRVDRLAQVLDEEPDAIEVGDILALKRKVGQLGLVWEDGLYCVSVLESAESPIISIAADREYFRDLLEKLRFGTKFYSRLETRLKDMHFQYMLHLQEKSEKRLRLLTVISAIFLPLTLLAGIYGMNFEVMPELKSTYGYFIILGLMVAIAGGLLAFFYRCGWFD